MSIPSADRNIDTPSHNLIAEFQFQGNALDTSGAGHHGHAHAVTYCDDRFGNSASASAFNGIDSYVEVAPPPAIDANTFSISVWVRFHEMPNEVWSNCVVAQDNGNDENAEQRIFQLSCFWKHIVWHMMVDDRDPIYRSQVRLHEYYHIVATCDHGVHTLYVDGEFRDRIHRDVPATTHQPLHIGRKGTTEQMFYLNGAVDDLRLYNSVLDQQHIDALYTERGYHKTFPPAEPVSPSAVAGEWGRGGVVFLDLQPRASVDAEVVAIAGRVMDGRPTRWADIVDGTFNCRTGLLRLNGIGAGPYGNAQAPYTITGTLDGDELTVSYDFDGSAGNLIFARF